MALQGALFRVGLMPDRAGGSPLLNANRPIQEFAERSSLFVRDLRDIGAAFMLRFAPGRACFLVRFGVRQWMPRRRQRLANRVEDRTGSFPCLFATGRFHSLSPVRTMGCYSGRQILSTFSRTGIPACHPLPTCRSSLSTKWHILQSVKQRAKTRLTGRNACPTRRSVRQDR